MTRSAKFVHNMTLLTFLADIQTHISPPANFPAAYVADPCGRTDFNKILSNTLGFMTSVAGIFFLIMVIVGSMQYIFAGGDKAATEAARGRITSGIIGLGIIVFAWVLLGIIGTVLGINLLSPLWPSVLLQCIR